MPWDLWLDQKCGLSQVSSSQVSAGLCCELARCFPERTLIAVGTVTHSCPWADSSHAWAHAWPCSQGTPVEEAWLPSCFLPIVKDVAGCVCLLFPFTNVAKGLIFFFFWATVWYFFCILASLCFRLYLVLLEPEQIFKIVNEETGHGEVEIHVPSSKTSELSEPEVFCSSLYT